MPLNPFNIDDTPFKMSDYTDSILKGYNAYLQPQKFRQEVEQTGLQNQQLGLTNQGMQAELPYKGPQAAANVQQTQEQAKQMAMQTFLNRIKSQYAGDIEAQQLEKLRQENEIYKSLKESEIRKNNRNSMSDLAKRFQAKAEIEAGYMPETGGQQRLTPAQQKSMLRQLELEDIMKASDSGARNKAALAQNIDTTLEQIDPKKLADYAGIWGTTKKGFNTAAGALYGGESKKFQEYQRQLAQVKVFAHQFRQFYGDSVSDAAKKDLHELTQPGIWSASPKIAIEKFNAMKNLLLTESKNLKKIIPKVNIYLNNDEDDQAPENDFYDTNDWEFD